MLSSQNPYSPERIDALTKTLSTMDPRARQKYAADHKNDPAVVAVALNVSNILAAAERNKAMQAGTQQQPKVVDQEIAGMAPPPQQMARLPEEQGIAQLPTPNMQNMADGGIAGYDDGGMTGASEFDYAQRSEPVVRMADGGHIPRYQGVPIAMGGDGSVVKSSLQNIEEANIAALGPLAQQFKQAEQQFIAAAKSGDQQAIAQYMQAKEVLRKQLEEAVSSKFGNTAPRVLNKLLSPDSAAPATPVVPAASATAKPPAALDVATSAAPEAPVKAPPPPGPTSERPQPALSAGLPTIKQAQELGDKFYNLKDIKGTFEQQEAQERQDILNEKEARIAKQEAFNKAQGPAMAGYEKLLKSEEMQDTTDKEKSGLMALFKGFLGMAAGESPNAAVNIAKGAMVGLGDYSDSLKEFKKSAKERNKAFASIEDARRAEAKGDFKAVEDAEDKANTYLRASKRHGIDAIVNATGKSAEVSSGIYKEMLQQANANARTNAQIAAGKGPGPQEHLFKTLGDGNVAKGLGVYASTMGPEAKGMEADLQAYIKNPMMLKATNPALAAQFDAIIQQRMGSMVKPTGSPTGQVLVGQ